MGCANAKPKTGSSSLPSATPSGRARSDSLSSQTHGPEAGGKWSNERGVWTVMAKYRMSMAKEDIMGEGTSSICRKATNIETGEQVAVKVYKAHKDGHKHEDVKMQKFRRQIQVLKDLQEPFQPPKDPGLWSEQLQHAKPSRLFMQLLDYSKDARGNPGPDPKDNILYVVTELAQYSLKDYLALRRDQCRPLPKDSVRSISRAIVLVVAGLHAKGLVHIDLKPENLMMFNGRLKLIDVDGCVKAGTPVSIQDSSISFSPCYCAPEWARFLIEDSESRIAVSPALDVWSVGMTICELVTLDAILKPMYANFLRNGHSHREAGFLFMEWLASVKKAPIPKNVEKFDPEFTELLVGWLLVFDPLRRKTCAQSLSHPYLAAAASSSASEKRPRNETRRGSGTENTLVVDGGDSVSRQPRGDRVEDVSDKVPMHKGALFKLDTGGDAKDPVHWRRRDMWISSNGSLCYFSIKDGKRLVLIDGAKLPGAKVTPLKGSVREPAFQVEVQSEDDAAGQDAVVFSFACESKEEYDEWTSKLQNVSVMDSMMKTMRLGKNMKNELEKFRLNIKNRRMVVAEREKDRFAPVFKAKLWKVKADGDRMKADDWFEREMWISKNGSLVYWSKKEERELVYYTSEDLLKANYRRLQDKDSCRPFSFQVQLPGAQEIEFAPGEFSAETEEMRTKWIEEFMKVTAQPR